MVHVMAAIRLIPALCLLAAGLIARQAWTAQPAFGGKIIIAATAGTELTTAARDLADILRTMTGVTYTLADRGTAGIILATTGSPLAPPDAAAKLKACGKEPFLIRADGSRRLWLAANDEMGVVHGIYWYLQQLGCRWFLPNDDFTCIPQRQNIVLTIDSVIRPAFTQRTYFGSGGFGHPSPADPTGQVPARWSRWDRRNLFGAEYRLGGHTWEAFIARHQQAFDQHPDYYALRNGKRGGAKICVSNPDVMKLYIDDCLTAAAGNAPAISIEPSDGTGYCECPDCAKLGKPEEVNQVYHYANAVAKAVGARYPHTILNMYAYGNHSAPPDFALEPNLLIQVIPYAFNYSGLSPEGLIDAWSKKVKHLTLYDYWSITDWGQNLPDDNLLCEPGAKKMQYWRAHGIEGVGLESTYSAGAAGLALYIYSRIMWDPRTERKALLDEFFTRCFGPAAPPMRRMLERWAHGYHPDRIEFGKTYADLAEARRLAARDPAILKRVADYAIYAQYLRQRMEYSTAPVVQQAQLQIPYLQLLWRQLPTAMMHPFRFTQVMAWKDADLQTSLGMKNGDWSDATVEFWRLTTPISQVEALGWIDAGARAYPPLRVERTFSDRLVPRVPVKAGQTASGYHPSLFLVGTVVFEVEAPPGLSRFTVKTIGGNAGNSLRLADSSGTVLQQEAIPAHASRDIDLPVPRPGRYRVTFEATKFGGTLQVPSGLPLTFRTIGFASLSPRLYFYVPKGTRTAYLLGDCAREYFTVLDPQGKPAPVAVSDLATFAVPTGMDGRIWSMQTLKGGFSGINIPWLLAFAPDELLAPVDLQQEAGTHPAGGVK